MVAVTAIAAHHAEAAEDPRCTNMVTALNYPSVTDRVRAFVHAGAYPDLASALFDCELPFLDHVALLGHDGASPELVPPFLGPVGESPFRAWESPDCTLLALLEGSAPQAVGSSQASCPVAAVATSRVLVGEHPWEGPP